MEPIAPSQECFSPVMKSSIWSNTPEHILERILACLLVEDLLRMRSVCKQWSSDILTVPMFRALHRAFSPPQQPWFLVSTSNRTFSAYDINTHKWNVLSVSHLPDSDLRVLASSQGLLCYGFRWDELTSTDLYMCNPITGEWRHLPQHPEKTVDHFGMHYDDKTNSYKILTMNVAATGGMIRRVTTYDSRSDQWNEAPVPNSAVLLSKAPMVWCLDRVYFMDRIQPFREMHAYNIVQCTWHELQAPGMYPFFEYPSLVACNERLFILGLRSDGRKIWEVVDRSVGLAFVECDTLPAQLPNEFAVKKVGQPVGSGRFANYNPFRLTAVGCNNLVCFSSNLDHTWVLIYDTETKSFHESPKDIPAEQLIDYANLPFQPCLDASP